MASDASRHSEEDLSVRAIDWATLSFPWTDTGTLLFAENGLAEPGGVCSAQVRCPSTWAR